MMSIDKVDLQASVSTPGWHNLLLDEAPELDRKVAALHAAFDDTDG